MKALSFVQSFIKHVVSLGRVSVMEVSLTLTYSLRNYFGLSQGHFKVKRQTQLIGTLVGAERT